MSGRLDALQAEILGQSAEYDAAEKADKEALEAELRASEAQRIAEEVAGGGDTDTKLPYKQRMRKVELNKGEGNELVKDGNFGEGAEGLAERTAGQQGPPGRQADRSTQLYAGTQARRHAGRQARSS